MALAGPAAGGELSVPGEAVVRSPIAPMQRLDAVSAQLLAAHNRERAAVGHPPLQWDPNLAAAAAAYGTQLERIGRLVHAPREQRQGQSENLAMAYRGTHSPGQLIDMWIREKQLMQPGLFPAVSRTGQWKDVGHYTQMVWQTTTHVGCAIHYAEWEYLVCRYSPKGNIDGRPVFDPRGGMAVAARR